MANSIIATAQQVAKQNPAGMEKYLTMNANRSFFQYSYSKVSNTARHTIMVPFNERVDFGRTITTTLPYMGDFVNGIHFYVKLPQLSIPEGSKYIGWTQSLAFAMIESVEIRFGETVIVRQPGNFLEVMDYLETSANKTVAQWKSVGRYDTVNVLANNALGYQDIYLPFNFWFNKKLSSSLPMFALSGQPVKFVIKLKPFLDVVTYDGLNEPIGVPIADAALIVDYHLVSKEEKDDYYQIDPYGNKYLTPLPYLIEQWQYMSFEINAGMTSNKFSLEFNNHIKELVFYIIETESEEQNDYFLFGRRMSALQGGEFLTKISLLFDGKERFEKLPESYYRLVTPQKYHSYAGNRNIYVMSMAEYPELNNPSGSVDFSAYSPVELSLDFVDNLPSCKLHVLGISYNRLIFMEDGVQLEYT